MTLSVGWVTFWSLLASVAPVAQIVSQGSSTASISGKVVDFVSGSPLKGATVVLEDEAGNALRRRTTEDAGRFSFDDLAPGTFHVIVSKSAYLKTEFGERGLGIGVPIVAAKGQLISNLTVRLMRSAALSGRVFDTTQDPVSSVVVVAIAAATDLRGQPSFHVAASAITDDTGAYRLFGLHAGQYLLAIVRYQSAAGATQRRAPMSLDGLRDLWRPIDFRIPQQQSDFAPVFLPGTTDPAQAQSITLSAGEDRNGLDFTFVVHPGGRIEATIVSILPATGAVRAVAFSHSAVPTAALKNLRAQAALGTGTPLVLPDLTPGPYTIVASASSANNASRDMWALGKVESQAGALTQLSLSLEKGFRIRGRIVSEPPTRESGSVGRLALRFSSSTENGLDFSLPPVVAASDGTIDAVVPRGIYLVDLVGDVGPGGPSLLALAGISVSGKPTDSFLKLRIDHNLDGLTFAVEDQTGHVTGKVVGPDGQPAVNSFLLIFSTEANRWTSDVGSPAPRRPATNGEFDFDELIPGDYYLVAVPQLDERTWIDEAFRRMLIPQAVRVHVSARTTTRQDLRIGDRTR